jgi:hypothetical protein
MKRVLFSICACALLVISPAPAQAQDPAADTASSSDCPTWFPDFRCERQARFAGFMPPSFTPYLFEDPFITTGVSAWYLYHEFPGRSVFRGGEARIMAVQARLALTDRLAFIATKDGYVDMRPDTGLLDTESGFADLMAGFKYALIHDEERELIVSPMIRYQTKTGSDDVHQGYGNGIWIPGVSIGWGPGAFHVIGAFNVQIPVDMSENSTVYTYNLQVDAGELLPRTTPFLGMSGYHYWDDGSGNNTVKLSGATGRLTYNQIQSALGLAGFEAVDYGNLGSNGVEHNDIITGAVGFRTTLTERVSMGFAYEIPLTSRKDIFQRRFTVNMELML